MIRAVALIALSSFTTSAFAIDGYVLTTGNLLNYGKSRHVQMVSEHIQVQLRDDDHLVDVTFLFKNHGPAHTVTMGFPEEAYNMRKTILWMRSYVDGKRVALQRKLIKSVEDGDSEALWLKKVSFKRGQSRKVRVRYLARSGFGSAGHSYAFYDLKTGSTWNGPIERCRITVDSSRVKSGRDLRLYFEREQEDNAIFPAIWKSVGPSKIETVIRSVSPDFQLVALLAPGFWRFKINGEEVPVAYAWYLSHWPQRRGDEVLIEPFSLGTLFAKGWDPEDGTLNHWSHPALGDKESRGWPKLVGPKSFQLPSGRLIQLNRATVNISANFYDKEPHLYLRDFIGAMGGAYRFNHQNGYVELSLPHL